MKKVLVIDEIRYCGECYLCHMMDFSYGDGYICGYNNEEVDFFKTLEECPLKDLPSKLESPNYAYDSYYHYNKGWNDLLNEIKNKNQK